MSAGANAIGSFLFAQVVNAILAFTALLIAIFTVLGRACWWCGRSRSWHCAMSGVCATCWLGQLLAGPGAACPRRCRQHQQAADCWYRVGTAACQKAIKRVRSIGYSKNDSPLLAPFVPGAVAPETNAKPAPAPASLGPARQAKTPHLPHSHASKSSTRQRWKRTPPERVEKFPQSRYIPLAVVFLAVLHVDDEGGYKVRRSVFKRGRSEWRQRNSAPMRAQIQNSAQWGRLLSGPLLLDLAARAGAAFAADSGGPWRIFGTVAGRQPCPGARSPLPRPGFLHRAHQRRRASRK